MIKTDEFSKDLCRTLTELQPAIAWSCGWSHEGRERVDLVGVPKRKNGRYILIEVELRRLSPVSNIVKIWRWIRKRQFHSRPLIFQAFSGFYSKHDSHRLNAEFIGRRMEQAGLVRYRSVSLPYKPRKGGKVGAGRRRYHAVNLAKRVSKTLAAKQ
jgi:hypothetical protein